MSERARERESERKSEREREGVGYQREREREKERERGGERDGGSRWLGKYGTVNARGLMGWRKVRIVVCWLLNVPATCECISGTDLLRQFYVLPH